MSEQPEQYADTSESSDSPPPASSMPAQLSSSGRQPGTPFQNSVMDAVSGSEFAESYDQGFLVRRKGNALRIPYDQAMEFLWPTQES